MKNVELALVSTRWWHWIVIKWTSFPSVLGLRGGTHGSRGMTLLGGSWVKGKCRQSETMSFNNAPWEHLPGGIHSKKLRSFLDSFGANHERKETITINDMAK